MMEFLLMLLGRGDEGRELREKITVIRAKPHHNPEERFLLSRNRYAWRLFRIYFFLGLGAVWTIYACEKIIPAVMGFPYRPWVMGPGEGPEDFLYKLPGLAILTLYAGLPFLLMASWSRRLFDRAILRGAPEKDFRNRVAHTKFVFSGTFLLAVVLYGAVWRGALGDDLEVFFLPPLLAIGAFLLYIAGTLFLKLQGPFNPEE